jgi:hypothetical protein
LALGAYLKKMPSLGHYESFQNCFQIKFDSVGSLQGGGGTRQQVKGLSKDSRRRLVKLINSLGESPEAFFVTLTMRTASENFKEWKKWLNRTLTAMRYRYPELSGIWRLEFQKRGTPHFHLLVFTNGQYPIKAFRASLRKYWSNAVGQHNTSFIHGVKVEKVRDVKKSGFYLAIYQAKNEQDRTDIPTGKTYGVINKDKLPVAQYSGGEFNSIQFNVWCKRLYRRYIKANGASTHSPLWFSLKDRTKGFTGFMSRPLQREFFSLCHDLTKELDLNANDLQQEPFSTQRLGCDHSHLFRPLPKAS